MFTGDTRELLSYRDVWEKNNNKKGFALHRGEYTSVLVEPATQFVTARGSALRRMTATSFESKRLARMTEEDDV